MTDEARLRRAAIVAHRILIIADNFLCDEFGLARQGRGQTDHQLTDDEDAGRRPKRSVSRIRDGGS